jgi:hypothetical protein
MEILKLFIRTLTPLIIFLLSTLSHLNCSNGWAVMGYEITPMDSVNTVFIEILDTDSIMHYYHESVFVKDNWCYIHNQLEDVKKAYE